MSSILPKIRLKNNKGGEFPFYEKTTLGNLAKWSSGGTPAKDESSFWDGDIPWMSAASMHERYYHTSPLKITAAGLKSGSKLAMKGALLLLVRGSMLWNRIPVGIVTRDVAFNQDVKCLTPDNKVHAEFLLQWFMASENLLLHKVVGTGIGAGKLDTDETKNLVVQLPSLDEQRKIADFLSSVDKRIEQLTQQKSLLEQYKKGVMQQLFTQKIRFKDDEGKDFPDWEEKKLGEVGSVVGGGTPDSTNEDYWNGDVQWFTPSEIRSKFASCSKRKISQLGLSKCSASMLPVGTLLFTSRATIAEVSLATEPCTTNQGFQSITVNQGASNEFIYYWVIQFKKDFLRKAQGSTFLEIGGKEMRKMPMLIPSGPEQTKIANFLSALDRKTESVTTQITETQTFKKGLLQQMFV